MRLTQWSFKSEIFDSFRLAEMKRPEVQIFSFNVTRGSRDIITNSHMMRLKSRDWTIASFANLLINILLCLQSWKHWK